MKIANQKAEINLIINKMSALLDHINEFAEIHEKDLLINYSCNNISNKNLSISEFHVIDCIGKNQLPNATFIAKELAMTKGAISKITAKLIEKDLIRGNRLENNKKEIYYSLTSPGKEAFAIHEKLHEVENKKFIAMLNKYNQEELSTISSFLDDLTNQLAHNKERS